MRFLSDLTTSPGSPTNVFDSGGTASQFLKGDGSLDSTVYGLSNLADDTGNSLLIGNTGTAGDILFTAQGTDTNVDIRFLPKGSGYVLIDNGTTTNQLAFGIENVNGFIVVEDLLGAGLDAITVRVDGNARFEFSGSYFGLGRTSGSDLNEIRVVGATANQDLLLTPKGTGTVVTSAAHTSNISAADDVLTKGYADANYGTGNVTKVGTPVNDQIGVWTGDGTIEGGTNLTWNATNLGLGATTSPGVIGIGLQTSDTTDNGGLSLYGGGAAASTRGARIDIYGNEHATLPGRIQFYSPGSSGSQYQFFYGVSDSLSALVETDGDWNFNQNNIDNVSSIFITEKAAADADVATYGQLWVKNDTPNTLWFTDDAGTDWQLNTSSGITDIVQDTTPQLGGNLDAQGYDINSAGVIFLNEQVSADADVGGDGQIWVKTATPNELWFTDDTGNDIPISQAVGWHLAKNATSQTLTTAATIYTLTWSSSDSSHVAEGVTFDGTDEITISTPGLYLIGAHVSITNPGATDITRVFLERDPGGGYVVMAQSEEEAPTTYLAIRKIQTVYLLSNGDKLRVRAVNLNANNASVSGASNYTSWYGAFLGSLS